MANEYWGTFSIYDHRTPIYRRSLILFDRVVIPVPTEVPRDTDLTEEEIEALRADVDYLEQHGAALRYEYSPSAFDVWLGEHAAEGIAANVNRDNLYESRLMLIDWVRRDPADVAVVALPVYESRARYDSQRETLGIYGQRFAIELLQRIVVPRHDVALEDIVRLRETATFQDALRRLREWQEESLPDLLIEFGSISGALAQKKRTESLRRFDEWTEAYSRIVRDAHMSTVEAVTTTLFDLGGALAGGAHGLVGLVPPAVSSLFKLRQIPTSAWKEARDRPCAPAGVIFEAERALRDA